MARAGKTLIDLATEIERQANSKEDFGCPVSKLSMAVEPNKGVPTLVLTNGKDTAYETNEIADEQIAAYTDIPAGYFKRMVKDDPALLAVNVNRWLRDKADAHDKRLVRTLDGRVRAFLSDRYRTLENFDLAQAVLPVLQQRNLMIISGEITERRMYLKAVDQNIALDVPTGRAMGDGSHMFFDTVSPGITISNSEVGSGALMVETSIYTRACTNLAMMGSTLRKTHLGGRASIADEIAALLSDETKKANDDALWLMIRDVVGGAFDAAKFEAMTKKLGKAAGDKIEADVPEVIERIGKKFSLNGGERSGVLAALIQGADLTRYGVHAAVTRFSQDKGLGYDRATELERLGGEIIDLSPAAWREISPRREELVAA